MHNFEFDLIYIAEKFSFTRKFLSLFYILEVILFVEKFSYLRTYGTYESSNLVKVKDIYNGLTEKIGGVDVKVDTRFYIAET